MGDSKTDAAKESKAARKSLPAWLNRVEKDGRTALLRASYEFAAVGYAPFLQRAKDGEGKTILEPSAPEKGFENSFFGCVPTSWLYEPAMGVPPDPYFP